MINGAHFLFYSKDPEADRAFFRDVLKFRFVDAGHGWLIFALPSAEVGIHPTEGDFGQQHGGEDLLGAVLYLMSPDLKATMAELQSRGVECAKVEEARWGSKTTFRLPSGGRIGLYQPSHPTAV
jgi:catechol 2,3-dioxygenase-like lactoylglutathione lyase family enzyme